MDISELLSQTDRIFNSNGAACDYGCAEDAVSEMIEYIKKELEPYSYCVVSDWVWLDIDASKKAIENLDKHGLKPCALYAHKVIYDEKMRAFESVRTTFLQSFHNNCIFLTQNTAYILKRPGTRVTVDSAVFASIFFA